MRYEWTLTEQGSRSSAEETTGTRPHKWVVEPGLYLQRLDSCRSLLEFQKEKLQPGPRGGRVQQSVSSSLVCRNLSVKLQTNMYFKLTPLKTLGAASPLMKAPASECVGARVHSSNLPLVILNHMFSSYTWFRFYLHISVFWDIYHNHWSGAVWLTGLVEVGTLLTTHEIVQLDVGERFDFCLILKLWSITDKHGLQEKEEGRRSKQLQ